MPIDQNKRLNECRGAAGDIEMEYLRVEYSNAVSYKCLSSRSPGKDRLMNDRYNVLRLDFSPPVSQSVLLAPLAVSSYCYRFTGSYHVISDAAHPTLLRKRRRVTTTLEASTDRPRPRRSSVLVLVLVLV